MQRELHVDGSAALRGGKLQHKPARVSKSRGARYETDADGISWAYTGKRKRAADAAASSPPPTKRQRRASTAKQPSRSDTISAIPSKKRKLTESTVADDADFLVETTRQLKKPKVSKTSSRQAEIRMMLPHLDILETGSRQHTRRRAPVGEQRREDVPDAYQLDAEEAKRFFRSTEQVNAPVFVADGATSIIDAGDLRRPIEQMLDWLPDPDETYATDDLEQAAVHGDVPGKTVTVSEIRDRFLNHQGYQPYPWNFPEIPFPRPETVPQFLQHPSCNLLRDIMRYVQGVTDNDVCPETCPRYGKTAEKCRKHFLTASEIVELQRGYQHWQGTIMLAEAGALTGPHFDSLGFSTLISCYEGEIGFAWNTKPVDEQHPAADKDDETQGRWLFKILRSGDAVYMGPGTRHLVFRKPQGKQTLASVVRSIRYCDIGCWLRTLSLEVQQSIDGDEARTEKYDRVVRGLAMGAEHLIKQAKDRENMERFGGVEKVELAEKVLSKIKRQLKRI